MKFSVVQAYLFQVNFQSKAFHFVAQTSLKRKFNDFLNVSFLAKYFIDFSPGSDSSSRYSNHSLRSLPSGRQTSRSSLQAGQRAKVRFNRIAKLVALI